MMRWLMRHILPVVAAGILSAGCASHSLNVIRPVREFHFDVAVNPCTRSEQADDQLTHPEDVPFGMWSFEQDGSAYLDNEKIVFSENGEWLPEVNKVWESEAEEMDFFAYSPHDRAEFDEEKGILIIGYDIDEGKDILYSRPLTVQKENSTDRILINFNRALTLVRFRVRVSAPDYVTITVKKIDVNGVYSKGDFQSLPEPAWNNHSEKREICFHDGSSELYMIPQVSEMTVNLLCDIKSGEYELKDQTLSASFTGYWKPGKISSYMVKIDGSLNVSVEKDNE